MEKDFKDLTPEELKVWRERIDRIIEQGRSLNGRGEIKEAPQQGSPKSIGQGVEN